MNSAEIVEPRPEIDNSATASERLLTRLGRRSFLRLWAWPNVYRDQRGRAGLVGKEVCDLLVVCDPHVIIFSDKECRYPRTGDHLRDWERWYRRAVLKSADQIWGAERWLRAYPDRLFVDKECTRELPIEIPSADRLIVHRVAVAHGASSACVEAFGGSGSLMLRSDIVGEDHWRAAPGGHVSPFCVGKISAERGFVHVMDDTTLDILLGTLDTISDFVAYLSKKEKLLESSTKCFIPGEEELLAHYLKRLNDAGDHDFNFPAIDSVMMEEGFWEAFKIHPDRKAQLAENEVSYAWDELIDTFAVNLLDGTSILEPVDSPISEHETALRLMAQESRTQRRMLAKSLFAVLERANGKVREARVMQPTMPGGPHYVFLAVSPSRRRRMLPRTNTESSGGPCFQCTRQ